MKKLLSIVLLACALSAHAAFLQPTNPLARVTLAWDHSPDARVTGYKVYWGIGSRQYTNAVNVGFTNAASIVGLVRGTTYYFAATAVASNSVEVLESVFSEEASYAPPTPPSPPSGFRSTNAVIAMKIETAPSVNGPWTLYATLGTSVEAPAFFRSVVSISPPTEPPPPARILMRSPKRNAS